MSKVEVTYLKGGRKRPVTKPQAELLYKLGCVTYTEQVPVPPAPPRPPADDEALISAAVAAFAAENGVNLDEVVGTGKDGRVKKSDVEAVIAARE